MAKYRIGYAVLFIVSLVAGASGFVAPSSPTRRGTELSGNTKVAPSVIPNDPKVLNAINIGEATREGRRTVYTHDDWRKHRKTDRFIYYLSAMFRSGVYQNLGREVIATTSVACAVCLYNALVGGYTDFSGEQHAAVIASSLLPVIGLPIVPFTLASPSLGLLLVFRTNTSYKRWDEARKNWGMNINHTRDLVRMGNAFYDTKSVPPERREEDLNRLALCTWAFVWSMKRHLSPEDEDEVAFQAELYGRLPQDQAKAIIDAAHRPNRALQDLSLAIENLPMHFMRKNQVQEAVTIFEDNLGSSERLLTSPVPLFYSRHTARFLAFWLLLLPFALYQPCAGSWKHLSMIPATAAISVFLFGIDEIATQLEEPFTILPMQAFCDKIYNWCMEIVSWKAGENGMPVNEVNPKHTTINFDSIGKKRGSKKPKASKVSVAKAAPVEPSPVVQATAAKESRVLQASPVKPSAEGQANAAKASQSAVQQTKPANTSPAVQTAVAARSAPVKASPPAIKVSPPVKTAPAVKSSPAVQATLAATRSAHVKASPAVQATLATTRSAPVKASPTAQVAPVLKTPVQNAPTKKAAVRTVVPSRTPLGKQPVLLLSSYQPVPPTDNPTPKRAAAIRSFFKRS